MWVVVTKSWSLSREGRRILPRCVCVVPRCRDRSVNLLEERKKPENRWKAHGQHEVWDVNLEYKSGRRMLSLMLPALCKKIYAASVVKSLGGFQCSVSSIAFRMKSTYTVFTRLNAANGSKITNKHRPRINTAPNQKNAAFIRGLKEKNNKYGTTR